MKKLLFLICFLTPFLTFSQDFYDWDQIRELKLYFERSNWSDILSRMKDLETEERMSATLYVDGKKFENVGVRFKGNSSYKSSKKGGATKLPFNIKIDYENKGEIEGSYETLKLSNGFRDPTFLREILSYEIARKYTHAPRSNFARLYINDQYFGIYCNTESVDNEFLKKHFGEKDGVFIKCDPSWSVKIPSNCPAGDKSSLMYLGEDPRCYMADYEMKSDTGWKSLIQLTEVLNKKPEDIEKYLDVDQALWMHAFNNVLVNLDSYTGRLSHNYYLYKAQSGLFVPILWDMNLSFGGFRYDGNGQPLENEELESLSTLVHFKNRNTKRPLIINLLQNPLWRKVYLAHIRTIIEENFEGEKFHNRVEELKKFIENEVKNDPVKLYSFEDFQNNIKTTVNLDGTDIIGLYELIDNRMQYLQSHPLFQFIPPVITKVEHFQFGNTLAVQATLENVENVYLYYRYSDKEPFTAIKMRDDSGHNDQLANDGIWGATIDFIPGTAYYIVCENEESARLSPERASFEFYQVVDQNSDGR